MAIKFKTNTPKKLLAAFKKAIDDGHITTWSYDKDGDFTHTPDQWVKKAWLRPSIIEKEQLVLSIVPPIETEISSEIYAIYHGRFIEAMLRHCDSLFTDAIATATPQGRDDVG